MITTPLGKQAQRVALSATSSEDSDDEFNWEAHPTNVPAFPYSAADPTCAFFTDVAILDPNQEQPQLPEGPCPPTDPNDFAITYLVDTAGPDPSCDTELMSVLRNRLRSVEEPPPPFSSSREEEAKDDRTQRELLEFAVEDLAKVVEGKQAAAPEHGLRPPLSPSVPERIPEENPFQTVSEGTYQEMLRALQGVVAAYK